MNALEASAHNAVNTDETYQMPCVRCAQRSRRLRTVAAVLQWVALTGLTVTIGFAAARLEHGAAKAYSTSECAPARREAPALERQQLAAHEAASAGAETVPPPVVVAPNGEAALALAAHLPCEAPRIAAEGEGEAPPSTATAHAKTKTSSPGATRVQRVDAPPAGKPAFELTSVEVDEPSVSPPLESDFRASNADITRRLKRQLAEGRRLLGQGQLDDAEHAFQRVLAIRRGQPQAHAGLARIYLAKGDIDRAKAFAEKAVDQAPYQAPYHVVLGDVLRVASDPQGAESEYRLAARLNPSTRVDRAARSLPANPF